MLQLHSVFMDDMVANWRVEEQPTPYDIFILVTKGCLTYTIEGIDVELDKGDLLFIPRGAVRSGVNHPRGPHQKYSAHFHNLQPEQFPVQPAHRYYKIRTRHLDYISQRFAVLIHQWMGRLPHYLMICQGILLEMLGHMGREAEMTIYSPVKLKLVKEIQDFLIRHYREAVSIAQLAELTGRSPNYITQTYKEVTGLTPIAYIHHLRMQTAVNLLTTSQITIGEASDYLGYSDHSHFNRMFKKLMGYPPSGVYRGKL